MKDINYIKGVLNNMGKKQISTTGANILTIGGVGAMLAIAGLSLPVSGVIMAYTIAGCYHLSKKDFK